MKEEESDKSTMGRIFGKMSELKSAKEAVREIEKCIRDEFRIHFVENREFLAGDIVTVFDSFNNQPLGNGVVGEGFRSLDTDLNTDKTLSEFNQNNAEIYYDVMSLKNDGTASKMHFFNHPHTIPANKHKYSDYYIKKLKQ